VPDQDLSIDQHLYILLKPLRNLVETGRDLAGPAFPLGPSRRGHLAIDPLDHGNRLAVFSDANASALFDLIQNFGEMRARL
jgi:hypothetical protein